jgi:hypothetical protein
MSVERNKDLARQAIGIWTTGAFDAVDELYAPTTSTTSTTIPTTLGISTARRL